MSIEVIHIIDQISREKGIERSILIDAMQSAMEAAARKNLPHLENLVSQFGESFFHGVYCANALDHCYSPMQVVQQMVSVVKPGGPVEILSFNDVGEMEQYQGLHQWNITIRDDRPLIWNKSTEIDVGNKLEGLGTAEGELDANLVLVHIRKATVD